LCYNKIPKRLVSSLLFLKLPNTTDKKAYFLTSCKNSPPLFTFIRFSYPELEAGSGSTIGPSGRKFVWQDWAEGVEGLAGMCLFVCLFVCLCTLMPIMVPHDPPKILSEGWDKKWPAKVCQTGFAQLGLAGIQKQIAEEGRYSYFMRQCLFF
jgi:hypothetical protein